MSFFNLADVFVALGRRLDNRPALVSGERRLTFAELATKSAQIAHALAGRGVRAGDNVGIGLRDGFDTVTHLVAIWMLDATGVIIDFRNPRDERLALQEEFDFASLLIDSMPPDAPYRGIAVGGAFAEEVARQSSAPPITMRAGTGIAVISLTSGTTGRPLGLMVRHEDSLLRLVQSDRGTYADGSTHLVSTPLHFSASRNRTVGSLLRGSTVHFVPPLFSPEELVDAVQRINPESLFLVPTIVRSMLDYARTQQGPLFPNLGRLVSGGSMTLPQAKREARILLTPNYSEVYASSLCGGISTLSGADIDTHADTVGRPNSLVRLEIVDENDYPQPDGIAGSIRVRTPAMANATYKDRTRPAGDRLKDGWVYPGDVGIMGVDGFLQIVGRGSDVIIRGGANVHPSEIESVLSTHPGVRAVSVAPYPTEREGEEIAAVIVGDGTIGEAEMLTFSRAKLSPDKRPRRFVFVDALPVTTVGKPDKAAIRKLVQDH